MFELKTSKRWEETAKKCIYLTYSITSSYRTQNKITALMKIKVQLQVAFGSWIISCKFLDFCKPKSCLPVKMKEKRKPLLCWYMKRVVRASESLFFPKIINTALRIQKQEFDAQVWITVFCFQVNYAYIHVNLLINGAHGSMRFNMTRSWPNN